MNKGSHFQQRWMAGLAGILLACQVYGEENRSPPVGITGRIEQVILPGPELEAVPVEDRLQPMIVRIVGVFPHGDSFRYDIEFQGMVPGKYNLADFLRCKDGSATVELPEVAVTIESRLPEGQVEPHSLDFSWWPRLGGYRSLAIILAIAWVGVLALLIFAGRRQNREVATVQPRKTFAELLRERVDKASRGEMRSEEYAELERMLIALWQRKLGLRQLPAGEALSQIRQDARSGPLILQLEKWLHSPEKPAGLDLEKLLEPYRDFPAEEWELSE